MSARPASPITAYQFFAWCAPALRWRRAAFCLLVSATVVSLAGWLAHILVASGLYAIAAITIAAFVAHVPVVAINFWNSLLGFLVLFSREPLTIVMPSRGLASEKASAITRTAVIMTIRNEDPKRALAHLNAIITSLGRTSYGDRFDYFVLSDSTDVKVIEAEEMELAAWRAAFADQIRLTYRRRAVNIGFKGGNLRDFCERWGHDYELMVPIDSDSLMSGETIVRLVRIVQANPSIGILQSFAVGLPSSSVFSRVYQFGHRLRMRCFLLGAAWWQGDRCQFWGHNAVIRVAPYRDHCQLPFLAAPRPFGGHIICHDQVEAALMHRAGYEVRFHATESGSFEGNPPTLLDFMQRNARWCLGNLQNLALFRSPGLSWTSRFHLAYMAQKFIGAASFVLFVPLIALMIALWPSDAAIPSGSAAALYVTYLAIYLAPSWLGFTDVLLRRNRQYGLPAQLLHSALVEQLFTLLLTPISMLSVALSITKQLSGRNVMWDGQRRDGYRVSWLHAFTKLVFPTAFGVVLFAFLLVATPNALGWFMPFLAGPLLSVPFAVVSASPGFGTWFAKFRVCATPEEIEMPTEISQIQSVLFRKA
jgi:membrane glycosyltransferase